MINSIHVACISLSIEAWVSHRSQFRTLFRCATISAVTTWATASSAQGFSDPGFESYEVAAGDFVKPTQGLWQFTNDAGVVEPISPNSSTGPLNTWSANYSAFDGQQYASTYAGSDNVRQTVRFNAPGDYLIGVYAAAPNGTVTIPSVGTLTLTDGEFTFRKNNTSFGSLHAVSAGSSWNLYTSVFAIDTPGNYDLGILNTRSDRYFINYDGFFIQSVPEPCAVMLILTALLAVICARQRDFQFRCGSAH